MIDVLTVAATAFSYLFFPVIIGACVVAEKRGAGKRK